MFVTFTAKKTKRLSVWLLAPRGTHPNTLFRENGLAEDLGFPIDVFTFSKNSAVPDKDLQSGYF